MCKGVKITEFSYKSYRSCFPTFNKEEIYFKLKLLKHFGAGNFNLFLAGILLSI